MTEVAYPRSADAVIATISELFINQGKAELAELLENAVACIEQTDYDNWDGGSYYWALRLEVPVASFAKIENRLKEIESDIAIKIGLFDRVYPRDHLNEVTILPISTATAALGKKVAPSSLDVTRIWGAHGFKLFLSHVSAHKVEVGNLRKELAVLGINAFVAHADIEPSLEWRDEIEIALRSMDALAALVTPEFHVSFWTDQEVGWAFGRGVLALPIMLGATPYGFLGKLQGVPGGDLINPADLAARIVKALLANRQTHSEMRRALLTAFGKVITYNQAKVVSKVLFQLRDFTDQEKAAIWQALEENDQIKDAFGVPDIIKRTIGNPPEAKKASTPDDFPF
jgi:hypothetical protein